tara:strand:- start:5830 stop:7572 length:1743 start_codon:yes stop_codon:yes gene_type:complete
MAWKKYFSVVSQDGTLSPVSGNTASQGNYNDFGKRNYSSYLPEVYTGHPNRVNRYSQYDSMDADSEINAALDIIAEFCTQKNADNQTPFEIKYNDTPTETEALVLRKALKNWTALNKLDKRAFRIFRNCIKYGDVFFVRDPETNELLHIDAQKVDKVIVNEAEGKRPEQYVVRDLNINLQNLTATEVPNQTQYSGGATGQNQGYQGYQGVGNYATAQTSGGASSTSRFQENMNQYAINAEHVVHASLSEGIGENYPFGTSILEQVFKVFKQKELLEDAILIYRIQRAPERRIFYIDVGNMPSHLAMQFVERVKNEIHQRRLPSNSGGGTNMMDAAYNPLSINEDYFFPQTAEGRGSKVDTLPGGTNLGEIDDLRYFTNKLYRGLKIPAAYLPTGPDDGANPQYNDGRVGTAYIQELRFNKYLERLQTLIVDPMDIEFKRFCKARGINVDSSMFKLKFNPPQNFASYRQVEMDNSRVQVFQGLAETPYLSKRFAMERYLGMTQDEIKRNQKMWKEENGEGEEADTGTEAMRSAGITPGGIQGDLGTADAGDVDTADLGTPPGAEDTGAPDVPEGDPDTPGL